MKVALVTAFAVFAPALWVACGFESSEVGVRDRVTPSMVKIQSQFGSIGSGFLVDGGYIVTAAHVAWPNTDLDVVFEDSVKYEGVPVVSYDHHADLAFLGPIETSAPGLRLAESKGLQEGDAVFAAGYSGTEMLSVNRGVAHERLGDWENADISILNSTARAVGGMSGGPMTNGSGDVVGVIARGGELGSAGAASDTVRRRLRRLEIGREASLLGSRILSDTGGMLEHEFVLDGVWDVETFVFRESSETPITIEFDADSDVEYAVIYGDGWSLFDYAYGTTFRLARKGIAPIYGSDEPGFLVVKQRFDREQAVRVRSSIPLPPYPDPDDGRELKVDVPVSGILDTAADIDHYTIRMYRGQRIRIRYISLSPGVVSIDHSGAPLGGVFSQESDWENAWIDVVYQAPFDGEFSIAVRHPDLRRHERTPPTGYTLTARVDGGDSQSVAVPERPSDVIGSVFGDTLRHTFEHSPPAIYIDYPLYITGSGAALLGATLFEQGRRGETLALGEQDLTFYGEALTVDQYVRRSVLASGLPIRGEKVTARREVETPTGSPALIEEFVADDGRTKGVRLAYVHEGTTGIMAIFYAASDIFDDWRPVVEYCIGTFSIDGRPVARQ